MTKLQFLLLILYLLGHRQKINAMAYDGPDTLSNDQGLKHTIHTLKGRYNEEVHRLKKCGNSMEENINEKPLISKNTESEITDEVDNSDNIFSNRKILSTTNTPVVDIGDVELTVLSQMLGNMDKPTLRQLSKVDEYSNIINSTNQKSVNNSSRVLNNSVLDSTEKHFEFESLIIKNEADKKETNNGHFIDNATDENNTRRFFPYDGNQGQYPVTYYNPFVNTPAKTYIPPQIINPQVNLNQQGNNLYNDNFNNSNPIPKQEQTDSNLAYVEVSTSTNNLSNEYKENIHEIHENNDDSDIDLFTNGQNNSYENINSRTSDPTKGFGISDLVKSNLMLIDHPRVCYACSSTNNPSCWSPGRWTPTKYCRLDHSACVTKTYRHKGFPFVIRDCGNTCQNRGFSELFILYQSCTICHSDLCNGAYTVQINFYTIIIMLIVLSYFKYST